MRFDDLEWVCQCNPGPGAGCGCTREEMALRCYAAAVPPRPMTAAERAWCIDEAVAAGEGTFTEAELSARDDGALARAVLAAWWDYVRCNGLA